MSELSPREVLKRFKRNNSYHHENDKAEKLKPVRISPHKQYPVSILVVSLPYAFLAHRHRLLVKNQSSRLIENSVTRLSNSGRPIEFFIVNKKLLWQKPDFGHHFSFHHHGCTMSVICISSNIKLSMILFLESVRLVATSVGINRTISCVLNNIRMRKIADLRTDDTN